MTAYVLSLENYSTRPKRELSIILKHLEREADTILTDKSHVIHRFHVKVHFIGRLAVLRSTLRQKLKAVERATRAHNQHVLNIAIAYGGQQEIVDATKQLIKKALKGILRPADINETMLKSHLYTNGQPNPDVIFRTGGEQRLSNFLPFQSAYSELIFTNKKWPEITEPDFDAMLAEFSRRKRRFGA